MGRILFHIKYDPMRSYADKIKKELDGVEYERPDLSANRNVQTIHNYLDQEERIHNLMILYRRLVVKDANDIRKMVSEMEEREEKRAGIWRNRIFNPGLNQNICVYGPPPIKTSPIDVLRTPASGNGGLGHSGGSGR